MHIRHPAAHPPAAVDVNGESVPVDGDTFALPDGAGRSWAQTFANAHGAPLEDVLVGETCDTVKSDGEVCGRGLPCPYHSDDEDADEVE